MVLALLGVSGASGSEGVSGVYWGWQNVGTQGPEGV